jgi:hypothetical protein
VLGEHVIELQEYDQGRKGASVNKDQDLVLARRFGGGLLEQDRGREIRGERLNWGCHDRRVHDRRPLSRRRVPTKPKLKVVVHEAKFAEKQA